MPRRTGNCIRLNVNGRSFGIICIRGMETFPPRYLPLRNMASINRGDKSMIASLVPLQRRGLFKFRNIIMTEPTFNSNLCDGNPGTSKELRNSFGLFTASGSSHIWSTDLYVRKSPIILDWSIEFIA